VKQRRPINRDDYARVLLLLEALELSVIEGELAAWQYLYDVHESREALDQPVHEGDVVGDQFLQQELSHARVLVESLALHSHSTMRSCSGVTARSCPQSV
jgi:hypothetical protein